MTLEEAYESYMGELTGYLRKTFGEDDLAQDAAQQAFSQAVFSLPNLDLMPGEALRAWLYATARNYVIDQFRRRKRLAYGELSDQEPSAQGLDAADREAIRAALLTLSEVQQNLVGMRYGQGYNSAEIARNMNMTAVNVRYHLMTAMRRLRRELEEDFS